MTGGTGRPLKKVGYDTYLGDIISSDSNIESSVSKGIGTMSKIMDILKSVSFGVHFFKT